MPIVARCANPDCKQSVRVKDELAGKKVRCPKCQGAIPIPTAAPAAPVMQPMMQPVAAPVKPTPAAPAAVAKQDQFEDDFTFGDDPPVVAASKAPAPEADFETDDLPLKKKDRDIDFDDEPLPAARSKMGREDEEEFIDEEDAKPAKKPARKQKRDPLADLPDTLWEDSELLKHNTLLSKVKLSFWGASYALTDPETGEEVGLAKERLPVWKGVMRPINLGLISFRNLMSTEIEIRDEPKSPALFTIRKCANPLPWQFTSTIQVLDFRRKLLGYFKTKLFSFSGGFWLYNADKEQVAEVKGKLTLKNPHLEFLTVDGDQLGLITAEPKSGMSKLLGTPGLVVALNEELGGHLETKVLLIAATMALELTGISKKLGGGAVTLFGGDDEGEDE